MFLSMDFRHWKSKERFARFLVERTRLVVVVVDILVSGMTQRMPAVLVVGLEDRTLESVGVDIQELLQIVGCRRVPIERSIEEHPRIVVLDWSYYCWGPT